MFLRSVSLFRGIASASAVCVVLSCGPSAVAEMIPLSAKIAGATVEVTHGMPGVFGLHGR